MKVRGRRVAWVVLVVALLAAGAANARSAPILNLREGATDPLTAERLRVVNEAWQAENPGKIPCRKCEYRPAGSNLLWTYYRRQGFFPNWVSAARDLRRRERAGETTTFRAGVDELVSYAVRYTSPQGITFRINESPYLSPDSTAPPWRDAMGQALVVTLFIPAIPPNPTPQDVDKAVTLATEFLNAFEVNWRDKGVAAETTAGGRWFLEYATERGDRARVLNGFMQALKSLDVFATQADALAADEPRWAVLRDRAREYVLGGARELDAHIDKYDYGRDQLSRYSLIDPNPAPPVYQTFHRQLLLWIRDVDYIPQEWRDHFERVRRQWGGKEICGAWWTACSLTAAARTVVTTWWGLALIAAGLVALALWMRRRQVVRRRAAVRHR